MRSILLIDYLLQVISLSSASTAGARLGFPPAIFSPHQPTTFCDAF